MMNLLDSDQEDFNEEENTNNSPYNQETEIEPLVIYNYLLPLQMYIIVNYLY
jgi:hypothetical protein